MIARTTRPTRTAARHAFTMLELIIVMGIILALVSLSVAGIMKALNYQQRRNTETTVSKLDQAVQKQLLRRIDRAKDESSDSARVAANNPIAWALAQSDGRGAQRAQVIHILMCLKRDFPTSFKEAAAPCPGVGTFANFAPNPAIVRGLPPPDPPPAPPLTWSGYTAEQQSSACLYLALKQSTRGGDFDPDTSLSSTELITDSNGVKIILDGWGKPVTFVRWPSAQLGALLSVPSTVGTLQAWSASSPPDKEDPEDLLNAAWVTWVTSQPAPIPAQAGQLFSATTQTFPYPLYPVTTTAGAQFRLTPVIWSYGSDGKAITRDDILNFDLTP